MIDMDYIKNPVEIEDRSFEIIQQIIDDIRPGYDFKNKVNENIIKRVIHTSADFEYLDTLKITDNAVDNIVKALSKGASIYTDTTMCLSGINKRILDRLNCRYSCLISDERTVLLSKNKGITRSMAAVEIAAMDTAPKIFIFGNAPTALYRAIEMHRQGKLDVEAIIGVPVGFVGAADSKYELSKTDIEHIVSLGRKGGSNIAAAILNAILYYYFK